MATTLSLTTRNARLDAITASLDAGGSNGFLEFWDLGFNNKLGSCDLSIPSATSNNGLLTFNLIQDDLSADATGTIAKARFVDSNINMVLETDCGLAGSGAEVVFNDLATVAGGSIHVISATITEGNA